MRKNTFRIAVFTWTLSILSLPAASETFNYSGGCFWCTEADSEKLEGVTEVISGFTGGTTPSPRYEVGKWGDHRQAAQIIYDPKIISYEDLIRSVFGTIDYEDNDGQSVIEAVPIALRFISKQIKNVLSLSV